MELEFTTTACNRPEILERTYKSFTTNLKGVNFKKSILYINIDPAPNNNNIINVEKVAKKYFGKVIANYPEKPNFASAIIWCFSQVKGVIFFHLEDDWLLNKKINLETMYNYSKKYSNWHQCILEKKIITQPNEPTLLPSLHNTKITQLFLTKVDNKTNPEAQLKCIYRDLKKRNFNLFTYIIWGKDLVTDIGRKWLNQNNLRRNYEETAQTSHNNRKWSPWISWTNNN